MLQQHPPPDQHDSNSHQADKQRRHRLPPALIGRKHYDKGGHEAVDQSSRVKIAGCGQDNLFDMGEQTCNRTAGERDA
jgi:hypothetical protein